MLTSGHTFADVSVLPNASRIDNFEGEYQIFIDLLYWRADSRYEDATVSFSLEAVSFPFIPDDFDPDHNQQACHYASDRTLNTKVVTDGSNTEYGLLVSTQGNNFADGYKGIGWQYGDYKIYQKVFNENIFLNSDYGISAGDYGLITEAYHVNPHGDGQCLIPHTIIKHTIYFHCGSSIDSTIIDSLSWLYDNTRGKMNEYPFELSEGVKNLELLNNHILDVAFRPVFNDFPGYASYIPYYYPWSSNEVYYNSGLSENHGSIDYFPPTEVLANWDICGPYALYYNESNPPDTNNPPILRSLHTSNTFTSDYVHPPPYALLNVPLLNSRVIEYAGYKENGDSLPGVKHTYLIEDSFDLRIINPSEKIIYNPSEVTIDCDLTFPCGYQFLTLHGKYPDKEHEVLHGDYSKEYWDAIPDFEFEYDRDYPVPVNCSTNSSCKSEYILNGGITLTFQPPIIIMDAHFRGTSTTNKTTIHYNPNRTYGNWTYDTASIELDSNKATLPACLSYVDPNIDSLGNKSAFNGNSINLEPGNHLKILNGLTQHPKIQVKLNSIRGAKIQVFDSMGSLKQAETIVSDNQSVDCSFLKPGVYHAVLIYNGEVIDKISFGKK